MSEEKEVRYKVGEDIEIKTRYGWIYASVMQDRCDFGCDCHIDEVSVHIPGDVYYGYHMVPKKFTRKYEKK